MSGERYGRAWLALDFIYCAIVGTIMVVLRDRLGDLMRLPAVLVAGIGAATIGWAMVVLGQTVRMDWPTGLKQVLVTNAVVSVLLAVAAALHPARGARLLLAFVSLDVMAVAAVQAVTLARRKRRAE